MPILPERWNINPPNDMVGGIGAPDALPSALVITSAGGF
jgi:hypothetical protein